MFRYDRKSPGCVLKQHTVEPTESGSNNPCVPGKTAKRDWVMNMNSCSYLSVFHEYVRRALHKQPVYQFKQLGEWPRGHWGRGGGGVKRMSATKLGEVTPVPRGNAYKNHNPRLKQGCYKLEASASVCLSLTSATNTPRFIIVRRSFKTKLYYFQM